MPAENYRQLFFLTCLCVLFTYLLTKPHCPQTDPAKPSGDDIAVVQTHYEAHVHNGWTHIKRELEFDPFERNLELWVKIRALQNQSATGQIPLMDGYITVYAKDKRCPYGSCPEVQKYDVELGVNKDCEKCPLVLYSGGSATRHVRIDPHADVTPKFDQIEVCNTVVTPALTEGKIFFFALPREVKDYGKASIFFNLAIMADVSFTPFLSEKEGILPF